MEGKKILFLPDAQVRPEVEIDHLLAVGRFIVDKKPDVIVCAGDFWDLSSLSIYDKPGSKTHEGKRYWKDVEAGNEAMALLLSPLDTYNKGRTSKKKGRYKPRMVFCLGNHEERIGRAINANPAHMDGVISYEDLDLSRWEVHGYQEIVEIEGILFSHNFVNSYSVMKSVLGGTIDSKMQKIGQSFVMGHQQQLQLGTRTLPSGKQLVGVVAGAFYSHEEDYMGAQGNRHWRGCVVLNDTKDGYGDIMTLSLDYLRRRYL